MINSNKVFAVITARGGSKRMPRKNIQPLADKPLIVWTIQAGLKSNYIDRVFVSSDDEEILVLSEGTGASTIKRPKHLASDTAKSVDVVMHALKKIDHDYEYVILLQPTSPLRNENHIDEAFDLLIKKNANAVISVCETDHKPFWTNILPDDGSMKFFFNDAKVNNSESNNHQVFYHLNGAIYICKTEKFLEEKTFFIKENIFAYQMSREHSIDIDDEFDWRFAEAIISGS